MASAAPKALLIRRFLSYLNGLDQCYAIDMKQADQPTLFCSRHGRTYVFEVAIQRGDFTEAQMARLKPWHDVADVAAIVRDLHDVQRYLA